MVENIIDVGNEHFTLTFEKAFSCNLNKKRITATQIQYENIFVELQVSFNRLEILAR